MMKFSGMLSKDKWFRPSHAVSTSTYPGNCNINRGVVVGRIRASASVLEVEQPSVDVSSGVNPSKITLESSVPTSTAITLELKELYESKRKVPGRPFLPPIDGFFETILGSEPKNYTSICIKQFVGPHEGPLRLIRPALPRSPNAAAPSTLPLLFYLPGIDGSGLAAYRQFPTLADAFDLRCVVYPPGDRTPFGKMAGVVADMVQREVDAVGCGRPVYLMGESFGGLLCLAVAATAEGRAVVDRLVLVNPATSFSNSPWPLLGPLLPSIPREIYSTLPFLLSPVLTNPFAIAMHSVDEKDPLVTQVSDFAHGLVGLTPELGNLRQVLPAATLGWRVQLLQEGCQYMDSRYREVKQKVLVFAGENDRLIPSNNEAPLLSKKLARCRNRILEGRSHALLQEAGVDIVQLIKEEGFYVERITLTTDAAVAAAAAATASNGSVNGSSSSSNGNGTNGSSGSSSSGSKGVRAKKARSSRPAVGSGAGFGEPGPLQVPSDLEVRKVTGEGLNLRSLVSPVFLSKDMEGRIVHGLGGVPDTRPLLFVGNHQLMAPDMPLIIEQFLLEKRMLIRGLAHPYALGGPPSRSTDPDSPDPAGQRSFGELLKTFGAVPVSGRNMFKLLEQGEAVMLFPGGAREALKLKAEKYSLIWPDKSEFVRMAARFGATIVPFAAVGAEDSLNMLLDNSEVQRVPLVGEWLRAQVGEVQQARVGVSASDVVVDDFLPPLLAPSLPDRFYFLYQQPIATSPEMADDKELCEKIYKQVKSEVEGGMGYLLQKRLSDPFRDVVPRMIYEATFKKQAPTFKI